MVIRQPSSAVRRSSVTGAWVTISPPRARTDSATASGRVPMPPSMPMNTGPDCGVVAVRPWIARTASVREVWVRAASKSWGTAERREMR